MKVWLSTDPNEIGVSTAGDVNKPAFRIVQMHPKQVHIINWLKNHNISVNDISVKWRPEVVKGEVDFWHTHMSNRLNAEVTIAARVSSISV